MSRTNDRRNSSSRALGHSDYFGSRNEIDLTLDDGELCALAIALDKALDAHGVSMVHEEVVRQPPNGYHATSHIGVLVDLRRRVDAARHGRKTWNRPKAA